VANVSCDYIVGMEEKELRALISLLEDSDPDVLDHVEGRIMSLGNSVIPFLEEEWENNFDPDVQKRIEELIHSLQFENLKFRLKDWRQNHNKDLLRGMWIIATYQYPDLEYKELEEELEKLYYETWLEMKNSDDPYEQVKTLNSIIFGKMKFMANTKNFHSPSNSMLNIVIQSRKGNPITLCVIYMMVAQKLKLPIYGVNLPNLFVLTYKDYDTQFYINAFNRGLIFSREDIDRYIQQLNLSAIEAFYQPCTNVEIVTRVFRNLIVSFEKLGEQDKVEEIRELLNSLLETTENED
jgi:regulator of sirC expression with transglutaminase-like and TPR domain